MDELPELRSDEDVDALMARLRSKLPAPSAPAHQAPEDPPLAGNALSQYLAAQAEATATMRRAIQVLAEAIEELHTDTAPHDERPKPRRRVRAVKRGAGR